MDVCIVVGARPQFIKAAELIHGGSRDDLNYSIVHTGQHYDPEMSAHFLEELRIPNPDANLGVGSGSHGWQAGEIMRRLEAYLLEAGTPDRMVVFGDTNSTLAAAVTAAKLLIPLAHVEAGLRSFDRSMPEEVNRVITDRLSALLFCPSDLAVDQLAKEGISDGVHKTGDIMYDSFVRYRESIGERAARVSGERGTDPWAVATIHRASNTDDPGRLSAVLSCLEAVEMPVVWPVHPRAHARLELLGGEVPGNVTLTKPVGYFTMLAHIKAASVVLTDSGGVQKEALWLETPCITLRDTTEWPETVDLGWNVLVSCDSSAVRDALDRSQPAVSGNPYGDGHAAQRMASLLIM